MGNSKPQFIHPKRHLKLEIRNQPKYQAVSATLAYPAWCFRAHNLRIL
jgi:hypothetical protein